MVTDAAGGLLDASPVVSVANIRRTAGGLVEVTFGLPDMTRRRVLLPVGLLTLDNIEWTAAALTVLVEITGGRL